MSLSSKSSEDVKSNLSYCNAERVELFCKTVNYHYNIVNGQSIMRSYNSNVQNIKKCEIYVSNIPHNINEIFLYKLFNQIGPIYELRMMINYHNNHRGFAFVTFFNASCVKKAIKFNYFKLDDNHVLYVRKSINNCTLYFGRIPHELKLWELQEHLSKIVDGIETIYFPSNINNENFNRGYAFVEFYTHRLAANAKKTLGFDSFNCNGKSITVDWALPLREIDEEEMEKVTRLYLYNLPIASTNEDVKSHIEHLIKEASGIIRVCKINDFCFVHFKTRALAEIALKVIQGTYLLNKQISVKWARPFDSKNADFYTDDFKRYLSLPSSVKRWNKILYDRSNNWDVFQQNILLKKPVKFQ